MKRFHNRRDATREAGGKTCEYLQEGTIMKRKLLVVLFVILLVSAVSVQAGGPPQPQYIEEPIHVSKDTSAYDYADNVRKASDHGCDDYWAIFYSTYPNLPGGVWADNLINQWHINQHNGLDGYFRCNPYDGCTTYLCTKHGWGADAWSVKVRW